MHGWIPITAQVVAGLLLIAAIGWRNRRWRLVWLPWAALVGVALAVTAYWYIASQGLSDQTNPAPYALWIWIGRESFLPHHDSRQITTRYGRVARSDVDTNGNRAHSPQS